MLSFFQPFYRARFFGWLNLSQPDPFAEAGTPPRMPDVPKSAGTTAAMGTER